MARTTTNYGFNISEGTDLVNPLTDIFPNFESLDTDLKDVSDATFGVATELKTGTVHALTRDDQDKTVFKFTATANFTAGDTFTLDGAQVSALTTAGEQLTTGCYIIGSEVIVAVKGTLLTFFISNVVTDASTLEGHSASYFATASDLSDTDADVLAVSNKVGSAVLTTTAQDCSGAINELNTDLSELNKVLWTNPNPTQTFAPQTIALDLTNYDAVKIEVRLTTSEGNHTTQEISKSNVSTSLTCPWDYTCYGLRVVSSVSDSGVVFGKGVAHIGGENNNYCIPQKIIGVKYN